VPEPSPIWLAPPDQLKLGQREVHIWRTSLDQSTETVTRLRGLLASDERSKADRFWFEKDRRHYTVARGVLRELLSRYLAEPPEAFHFTYSGYGKPSLDSTNLKFNLAHSGQVAVYAFTLIGEVGIDVEFIRPEFTGDEIARRFFSNTEVNSLNEVTQETRHLAFFNCWSRKEAVIKAKGLGLSLGLDQFDVTLAPGEPAALLRTLWDEAEAERWSLRAIDVGEEYAAAIAIESHDWEASYFQYEVGNQ
jgi:4'-phosphopantetheinyl transferase